MAVTQHFTIELPGEHGNPGTIHMLTREQAEELYKDMDEALYPEPDRGEMGWNPEWGNPKDWVTPPMGPEDPGWSEPEPATPAIFDTSTSITVEAAERKLAAQQATQAQSARPGTVGNLHV